VKGTRELVSPPYVIVYRSTEEIVEILHIWHGMQDWRWKQTAGFSLAALFFGRTKGNI